MAGRAAGRNQEPAHRTPAAQARDGRLAAYRARRDFARTPEPPPGTGTAPSAGRRFVVQRHRARRLHYDLRFEIDGVLASWAVPRGPTLDPAVRRMAVHVEDHPIEYLDFEGVIPAGEYGGGDVIVWDTGTWDTAGHGDPAAAVAGGELHAQMHGHKLRGKLVLVRTGRPGGGRGSSGRGEGGQPEGDGDQPGDQWLLLHKDDRYAVAGWDPEDHPRSVLSGRTNDEVGADPQRIWRSDLPAALASVAVRGGQVPDGPGDAELAALDALGAGGTWEVFGRRLRLTNLDKVLFPPRDSRPGEAPVTKREFIAYTARIAPVALPYLAGRALNMHRFPGGAGTSGFWHKDLPAHAPGWITRWRNPGAEPGAASAYLVCDEPATLVWAANFGALEWHAWTSRTASPDRPTYVLIDIDPGPETSWEDVLLLARLHRVALDHVGMLGQAKVTGRRGIQIWIPIAAGPAGPTFADTRAWAGALSRAIGSVVPDLVSWKWDVRERGGRARLDYTQNAVGKTLVAPYSPRAAPGAPVSAPIGWEELDGQALRPDGFTIRDIPGRLAERGDPFAAVLIAGQRLRPLDGQERLGAPGRRR
jgi:bifunctional non-homologous end joining protein LigD